MAQSLSLRLANRNPMIIISGLGASAAVLMLVFRDSILGVVAGVQLTFNDMLRPGDWISMPSHGINGIVTEVLLTTVKVRNYDMTTVTIPPYTLVSESFQELARDARERRTAHHAVVQYRHQHNPPPVSR